MHNRKILSFLCYGLIPTIFVPAAKSGETDWNTGNSSKSKNVVYESLDPSPDPGFNFGFVDSYAYSRNSFNNDIQSYSGGVVVPVLSNRDHVLFLDGRFTWNEPLDEQINVGLVHRWRLNRDWVIGESIYYDRGNSRNGNQFDRFGLGFEILGDSTEIHFNYYLPEDQKEYISTRKTTSMERGKFRYAGRSGSMRKYERTDYRKTITYRAQEASMEGLDIEIDQKVPLLPDWFNLWASAGYYDFKNPFGSDLEGFKAGVEWRLNDYVTLGAKYFDERHFITGDHWFAGVEVSLPLDGEGLNGMAEKIFTPTSNSGLGNDRKILSPVDREYRPRMSESGWKVTDVDTQMSKSVKRQRISVPVSPRNTPPAPAPAPAPAQQFDHDGNLIVP